MFAIRESRTGYDRRMLKPHDLVLVTWVAITRGSTWTYQELSVDLALSVSEVHAGARRARQARLLIGKEPVRSSLLTVLKDAFRHVYFAELGGEARGLPTGACAPPLSDHFPQIDCRVWPDPLGPVRGFSFSPLYKNAPKAARRDPSTYEILALMDGLRDESTRVRAIAYRYLEDRIRREGNS
jgi:hypothetical protein